MPRNFHRLLMIIALLPFVAAGVSLPQAAYAQNAPSGKCVAPLPPDPGENPNDQDKNQDLSRKLDTCNGELKAPPVGDGKMVEPAPDTGNARVIKPGELPGNANPSNGSGG